MAGRSYRKRGLAFRRGGVGVSEQQIRDLQRDLRELGYLKKGIDGRFGPGTERAVRALQWDLLHNDGRSTGGDGNAPVQLLDFNRRRVVEVSGVADQGPKKLHVIDPGLVAAFQGNPDRDVGRKLETTVFLHVSS